MDPSNNPETPPQPFNNPPLQPTPARSVVRPVLKFIGILLLILVYTGLVMFGSIWGYKKHAAQQAVDKQNQINPHHVVQQALVSNLATTSFHRHITYRDNVDRGMLVTWDIDTDISNPRDPKTAGTLSVNYLRNKQTYTQTLEFVALEAKSGRHTVYARMVQGNEITGASKDWFLFDFYRPYYLDPFNKSALYYRDNKFDMFSSNAKAVGFQSFKGFDLSQYNSPGTYIIVANMRDSQEKAKIVSELQNDKAYVLQNCSKNETISWCGGSTNTGGISSIDINLATSEGLGETPGLDFEATPIWLTADNKTKRLIKLEVDAPGSDKYITQFSMYNRPLTISAPTL
jgi:hypothetical protein